MQIIFSLLKSLSVLLLLACLGRFVPSYFIYVAFGLLFISIAVFRKNYYTMARDRVDCYFGIVSSVLAVFLLQFDCIIGDSESVNLVQFGILVWILISLTRLIENNRTVK